MSSSYTLTSYRRSHLSGTILAHRDIPGDKSISHRALMFGALAQGETVITGLNNGEDVEHTEYALRDLGVRIESLANGDKVVFGLDSNSFKQPQAPIYLGNSGTTARLLSGLITPFPISVRLYGDNSLNKRPMRRVILPLEDFGATFTTTDEHTLPLTIKGATTPSPINYSLPVPSSQVKSAIIFAALRTPGITTIIEPVKTRDHSERMMRYLGIDFKSNEIDGKIHIEIPGPQYFQAKPISVPADPSAAAFLVVAGLITPRSRLVITGINWNPSRRRVFEVLQEMGAQLTVTNERIECEEPIVDLIVESSELQAITLEAEHAASLIDEYPILSIAAGLARGISVFKGLRELRYKESDRLGAIDKYLNACGIETRIEDENLIIRGNGNSPIVGGITIDTENDHRIAMAFYIMGMAARNPIIIRGSDAISSSFPNFVNVVEGLSYLKAA